MKPHGMDFDFEQAEKLREKYTKCLEEAKDRFIEACKPIKKKIDEYNETHPMKPIENPPNYNSSDQMRAIFYDIIKIGTVYRKEPKGTGKQVIEAILSSEKLKDSPIIPIVKALNEVKMYDKAISSFIDKLTEDAKLHKGKIHANINLTGTRTGRLSSSNPKNWAYAL
jgi:DNA polymerase I-like protein with 3'-5' exonuclease and polymerase domains